MNRDRSRGSLLVPARLLSILRQSELAEMDSPLSGHLQNTTAASRSFGACRQQWLRKLHETLTNASEDTQTSNIHPSELVTPCRNGTSTRSLGD